MKSLLRMVTVCGLVFTPVAIASGSPVHAGVKSCSFTNEIAGPVVTEIDVPVTEAFFAEPFDLSALKNYFAANHPSLSTFFDPAQLRVTYVSEGINNEAWNTLDIEIDGATFVTVPQSSGETSTSPLFGSGVGYVYFYMMNLAEAFGKTNADLAAFVNAASYPISLRIATQLTQGGPDLCSFTYNFTFGSGDESEPDFGGGDESQLDLCNGQYSGLCGLLAGQSQPNRELPNTR